MYFLHRQILRFALVGATATCVHVGIVIGLVSGISVPPLWANIPAFTLAFFVSYFGHLAWTFEVCGGHRRRLPRFLMITLLAFGLNQAILYWAVERLFLDYRLGLALVVVLVPPFVFLAGRIFAFADEESGATKRPQTAANA